MGMHRFDCRIFLQTIWWKDPPEIALALNDSVIFQGALEQDRDFSIHRNLPNGIHRLCLTLFNKVDADTVHNKDKAVIVQAVDFFGLRSPHFVWRGQYQPIYPEPWATQQKTKGVILDQTLQGHNRISWNGTWFLEFSSPIFTWIHQAHDLGWIHE